MKTALVLLATALVYQVAECSPANMLADKTLAKMTAWIQAEGPNWVTLSGHFEEGIVQGQTNDNYTLALAGPAFNLDGSLSRVSEASLIDGIPDPNYDSSEKLIFSVAIKNVTVDYRHVAYNDDNNGFFNITSMGTSDGISAKITIDLKGSGDSCMGFADQVTVDFSGSLYVSTDGLQEAFPQVIAAVSNHFRTNVPNAIGLLMEAAVFNSLDGFDVCTGVFNPLPQANVMARRIINAMQDGLNQNIQYWAELPGFWKTDSDLNGTTMDQVVVRAGNFSSIGTLTRLGEATYWYSTNGDATTSYLNFTIEADKVTGVYGDILFTTTGNVQYNLGEQVAAGRIRTSYSVAFTVPSGSTKPSCTGGSQQVSSQYVTDDEVYLTYIGDDVPSEADDVQILYNLVSKGFMEVINGAAEDLFINVGQQALAKVCH